MSHIPVLAQEVLKALQPAHAGRVIDGTLGLGGHAALLLEAGAQEVLGLDLDTTVLEQAKENLAQYGQRVHIVHTSYVDMAAEAYRLGWDCVDGILLDLGVSSLQLDVPERGFAFRHDGPLDMRFDPQGSRLPASELVNRLDEAELADIFFEYGEERFSRKIARVIVAGRPYHTTRELAEQVEHALPRRREDKIHPATRIFQALRIAVNDELSTIEQTLPDAIRLLKPGGRLAVISFHSLEDRIVKQAFKRESTDCICPPKTPVCVCGHKASVRLVSRKPIEATQEEIARNPRSRSAKLRVVEKL